MPLLRNYYVRTVLISWRSAVKPPRRGTSSHTPDEPLPRRVFRADAASEGSRVVNTAGSPFGRRFRTDLP
jgi:hypothetical protein